MLTWDPRGFGDSGGVVQVDSPDAEARDVKRLVTYVAAQPEAKLDGRRDPRVGMTGASYGGGIQLSAAAIDRRIDVIVPDIAWHSLTTSLYKDSTFKAGWGTLLYTLGKADREPRPAHRQRLPRRADDRSHLRGGRGLVPRPRPR